MGKMSDEARELLLYTQNDGDIYRSSVQPIEKNLSRKLEKEKYDHNLAWKAWIYVIEAGAKKYVKELGSPGDKWSIMFPKNVRIEAAKEWADEWYEEAQIQGASAVSLSTRTKGVSMKLSVKKEIIAELKKANRPDLARAFARGIAKKQVVAEDTGAVVSELKQMGILPSSASGFSAIGQDPTWESLYQHPTVKAKVAAVAKCLKAGKSKLANIVAKFPVKSK